MENLGLYKTARRVVIFMIGMTILLFGILLIFIPGPAIIVIPLGLLILATEFIWAKKILDKMKQKMGRKK